MSRFHDSDDYVRIDMLIAERLGMNEALFLSRLHFRLSGAGGFTRDGERYYRNTVTQWQAEFRNTMSVSTIERVIRRLEDEGILLSCKAGNGFDQTKGYRINHEHPDVCSPSSVPTPSPHAEGSHSLTETGCTINTKKQSKQQGSPTTVDDVMLAQVYDRKEQIDLVRSNPTHGPTLARFWQRAMTHYGHAHATQPKMSIKDQKILKDLVERLPDAPVKILDVLEHYALFVKLSQTGYNMKQPAKPRPQSLLYAIDAMAEFEAPGATTGEVDYDNLGLQGLEDDGSNSSTDA
jgi:DNA-binding Lrp family transcriptional regulator